MILMTGGLQLVALASCRLRAHFAAGSDRVYLRTKETSLRAGENRWDQGDGQKPGRLGRSSAAPLHGCWLNGTSRPLRWRRRWSC